MATEERLEKLERELACAKRRTRWLLAVLVLWIGAWVAVWALSGENQGRYALSAEGDSPWVYILDTRTGQLWHRLPYRGLSYDFGTIDNPKMERREKETEETEAPL